MKISASIFSDSKENEILTTIKNLNDNHVDMIHVDCKDDLSVFESVKIIRANSSLPIDMHIITDQPEAFYEGLVQYDIEGVTFQYENLKQKALKLPSNFKGNKGIGITTSTPVNAFETYKNDFDHVLLMATVPGESGGKFDKINFQKIRDFRAAYPDIKIHVDGGVNAEVSFILRNMGVYASVSGSYLFNSSSIGSALLNLKLNEIESHYLVKDFMLETHQSPIIQINDLNLSTLLQTMNSGKLGVAIVNDGNRFVGIIGNADLRNGLLDNINQLNDMDLTVLINKNPLSIKENYTVHQMLSYIKQQTKPVLYLPVINEAEETVGTVSFLNLIKGEL